MEYWENCRRCTGLMKEKHFEKPAEVQNYFIHRVAELVEAAGKKMGGWSEIMDGGELPSGTVVFSWIGLDHGIAAAPVSYTHLLRYVLQIPISEQNASPNMPLNPRD